jgi:hypothetical protein
LPEADLVARILIPSLGYLLLEFSLQILILLRELPEGIVNLFELSIELKDALCISFLDFIVLSEQVLDLLFIVLEGLLDLVFHMVVDVVFVLLEGVLDLLVVCLEQVVFLCFGFELDAESFDFLGNERESIFVLGDPSLEILVFAEDVGVVLLIDGGFLVELELVEVVLVLEVAKLLLEEVVLLTQVAEVDVAVVGDAGELVLLLGDSSL